MHLAGLIVAKEKWDLGFAAESIGDVTVFESYLQLDCFTVQATSHFLCPAQNLIRHRSDWLRP